MSPALYRFFVAELGSLLGLIFMPKHGCTLSSPPLEIMFLGICFILIPWMCLRLDNSKLAWGLAASTLVITVLLGTVYIEVIHWDHYPERFLAGQHL
ncbi:MAG: hypothetical protein CMO55_00265 [Verrucomicrobiales bacterium]|nr:hypothetical protein [Verrucomicrobiales bacterium]